MGGILRLEKLKQCLAGSFLNRKRTVVTIDPFIGFHIYASTAVVDHEDLDQEVDRIN